MSTDQKKINIFLPFEIKKRELLSKVLLSKFLISNKKKIKIRCYIGSKTQIRKLIFLKKNYGGIFLYKGGLPFNQMKNLKTKVEKYIILDEEIGPASTWSIKRDLPKRLWKGTGKFIDSYYLIGKYVYGLSKKIFPKLQSKIKITGWPRVDLWRPEFNYIYKDTVKNLKKSHGKFILFSSDFTFTSIKRVNHEIEFWRNSEWKVMSENLNFIKNNAEKQLLEFQENIKFIRELDKRSDIPQIIVRPHPSDDLLEWRKIAKTLKRIKVIYRGEVTSWIYASSGVLHRGCTSAVEAYMAGIKSGYIVTNKEWIRQDLPYKLSKRLYSPNQIAEFCKYNIDKKPSPLKKYSDAFKSIVHIEKKFACELIAEDMLKFNVTSEPPCHHSVITKILDILTVRLKKINGFIIISIRKFKTNILLPDKMEGGVTKKEIKNVLKSLEPNHKLKVRQVLTDCVEIE